MRVLGLHGFAGSDSHDASAALLVDGALIIAAEEERFVRKKHAKHLSPHSAAVTCLRYAGLDFEDLDAIAAPWNEGGEDVVEVTGSQREGWLRTVLPEELYRSGAIPPVFFVKHHLSHIAAGYYLSGFNRALCICVDGQGEDMSSTIAQACEGRISVLETHARSWSLGALYEAAAQYAGLGYDVPGKLMGLASYGRPNVRSPFSFNTHLGRFEADGQFRHDRLTDAYSVCREAEGFLAANAWPYAPAIADEVMMYADVAASAQSWIEHGLCGLARRGYSITHKRNLVLTGGVALNCLSNSRVERLGLFESVYVPPGSNDASCSIGAAFVANRCMSESTCELSLPYHSARLGRLYSPDEMGVAISNAGLSAGYLEPEEICERVVSDLVANRVVAWFEGRSEFGPRALGARSLLSSATSRRNLQRINAIKGRESWRPLAPSILWDRFTDYFDHAPSALSRFMLHAVSVHECQRPLVPAIVHVDGTTRPHAVVENVDGRFFDLLKAYTSATGIPLLVNTSLNGESEPIVETPQDAVALYVRSKAVDTLVIGNAYISRP